MIFERMTEGELTEYLWSIRWMEGRIREKREELRRTAVSVEEYIEKNAYAARQIKEEPAPYGGFRRTDTVHRMLERSCREYEERLEELSRETFQLEAEEEKLRYVMDCLHRLPLSQSDLIEALYLEGMSWEAYGQANYISRTTVQRRRKRAVGNLLILYNKKFEEEKAEPEGEGMAKRKQEESDKEKPKKQKESGDHEQAGRQI